MMLGAIILGVLSAVCFICAIAVKVFRVRYYQKSMHKMTADDFRKDVRLSELQFNAAYAGGFFLVSALIMLLGWIT